MAAALGLGDLDEKGCGDPSKLLIRTASNAYFPQIMSVISIPDSMSKVEEVVLANWDGLLKKIPSLEKLRELRELMDDLKLRFEGFTDEEIFSTMEEVRSGVKPNALAKPVKEVEFEKLAKARLEAVGDDPEGDFYARELSNAKWADPRLDSIEKIVLVHKLREVAALIGFTRFEPITADAQGELEINVERAAIGKKLNFLPVSENRGKASSSSSTKRKSNLGWRNRRFRRAFWNWSDPSTHGRKTTLERKPFSPEPHSSCSTRCRIF
jgi:hypothetical protein